jgi:colanic acid/amylovoran biosynthesis protein
MKVLVTHVYSCENAGDAALLSVLLADLRSIDPGVDITILTLSPTLPGETCEGFPIRHSLMFYAQNRFRWRLMKLGYAAYVLAACTMRAIVFVRTGRRVPLHSDLGNLMQLYEETDAIVPVGGGYLRGDASLTSSVNLVLLLHPLVVGRILNKPTVLYPQSVGPFGGRLQRSLASAVLRRVDLVMAREDISVALLARERVSSNVVRSVDAGFAFAASNDVDLRQRLLVPSDHLFVGITVRQWLDGTRQARYERAIAGLADAILDRHHATVVFLPQVTSEHHDDDDRVVSARVAQAMRHRAEVILSKLDHRGVAGLYRSLDVLIGTRFHSVIFALTALVPVIAIEYEHKTSGIMRELGLEDWVRDIQDVSASGLLDTFETLIAERDSYRQHLRARLPSYQDKARQSKYLLRGVLDARLLPTSRHTSEES